MQCFTDFALTFGEAPTGCSMLQHAKGVKKLGAVGGASESIPQRPDPIQHVWGQGVMPKPC